MKWTVNMRELMIASIALAAMAAPAAAETRELSGFDEVAISGRYTADVSVGPSYSVQVEGPDAARIRTRIENGALKVEPMNRAWFHERRYNVTVHVTAPRLEGVSAARGASVGASGGGECGNFSANAAMGAELTVRDLHCDLVDASAAMGAELTLAGVCGALDVSAAMGADVDARQLRCETVDASAAMGADVDAFALDRYDASASMGADISVAGGGRQSGRSTTMGGSVRADR
ncbi:MAG: head GIN domain-containing protein [Hyphomonadaceae bacterium]